MKKAIFIVGPTATGKTDLAFYISKRILGTIVSADSVQVYKGLDIISGKDLPVRAQFKKDHYKVDSAKICLLDEVSPIKSFNVADFFRRAKSIIDNTYKERKTPLIVGGTGFYIDALISGIDTLEIPPNKKLREKFSKFSTGNLQKELQKINPEKFQSMNKSDSNNPRRLIRAIEVMVFKNKTLSRVQPYFKEGEVLFIGLRMDMGLLGKRIRKRVEKRFTQGALGEAKELFKQYEQLSNQVKTANGYRQLFDYLKKNISFEEAKEKWINKELQTAKNQMKWFKRNKNITWFDASEIGFKDKVIKLIEKTFLA